MKVEDLKNKKILILGYGIEGKATQHFLRSLLPNIKIGIADQKDGHDYLEKQQDYDLVIKSPGIPKHLVTIPYTTATNIFFANVKGKTIGVTGSKGKSTTTALIYEILKNAGLKALLVGNIGHPMLEALSKSNTIEDIWVCELSSFQLDDIRYSPHISVILNLYTEHLDYHKTLEEYFVAKKNIVAQARENDFFVYNPAFEELGQLKTKAKIIPFIDAMPFDEKIIPLLGEHNKDNVRAAVTVARLLNIADKYIASAIKNFKSLPHRLELVGAFKGIIFYDDAIATIPQATIAAIETLGKIGTIFLGGSERGQDFDKLADAIIYKKITKIVIFPDTGPKILKLIRAKAKNLPHIFETTRMEEAVQFAYKYTPKGTICLLSCASPSFSLWKNFEEKGDLFRKFVKKYGK